MYNSVLMNKTLQVTTLYMNFVLNFCYDNTVAHKMTVMVQSPTTTMGENMTTDGMDCTNK